MATVTGSNSIVNGKDVLNKEFQYTNDDADLDRQTEQQQNQIEREIAEQQPLLSEKISTIDLKKEYSDDDRIYQGKLLELMKNYKFIRRTRGDGNCFYRAFGFGYLEANLKNVDELNRFRQLAFDLKEKLVQLGYLDFTVEDVRDTVLEVVENVRKNGDEQILMESFTSISYSDYFVAYLRLFTSAHLQLNSAFFENFIEAGKSIKEFCSSEVEPMTRESDNIHITALSQATGVPVRVIYMDHSEKSSLTIHEFGGSETSSSDEFQPMITLLYRPGHYDLLYKD